MYKIIDNILSPETLALADKATAAGEWKFQTNVNPEFKDDKQNSELCHVGTMYGSVVNDALRAIAKDLSSNQELREFAFPIRMQLPKFNRYETGQHYATHADMWAMGNPLTRTDLSVTIWLYDGFEGGDLRIYEAAGGYDVHSPLRNRAIVYPATLLHEVTPVTDGIRYACVTWIQSIYKDHTQRQMLADFLRNWKSLQKTVGHSDELTELGAIYNRLCHTWSNL